MPILNGVEGAGVPVVVEVGGAGTNAPPTVVNGGSLPVTGMGLALVVAAVLLVLTGVVLKVVQR